MPFAPVYGKSVAPMVFDPTTGQMVPANMLQQSASPFVQPNQLSTEAQLYSNPGLNVADAAFNGVGNMGQNGTQNIQYGLDPATMAYQAGSEVVKAGLGAIDSGQQQTPLQDEQTRRIHKDTDYTYPEGYSYSEWATPYAEQAYGVGQAGKEFAQTGQVSDATRRQALGAASPASSKGLAMQVGSNRLKSVVFMQNMARLAPLLGLISAGAMIAPGATAAVAGAGLGAMAYGRSQSDYGQEQQQQRQEKLKGLFRS